MESKIHAPRLMKHFQRYLLYWTALFLWAISGISFAQQFEHGERPPNAVFDPLGLLNAEALRRIAEPLLRLLVEDEIDVIVVVLDDLGGAPPEFVAKRFSQAWCSGPAHAIVLHVPSHPDSPWIVPGGTAVEQIQRSVLNERLAQARRNAMREPTDADKVRTATVEAADMLRFWTSGTMVHDEMVTAVRKAAMEKFLQEHRVRKIRVYVLAGIAILLVICLLVLLLWWRKPKHRTFPDFHPPRRLGAPHGGGNHVVVEFSPPTPPDS
jgi:hypothetical protein